MRTDYTALNTYRTVIDANKKASDLVLDELSRIFIVNGRADDHALEIYLRAWKLLKRREQLAGGLYACLRWVPKTESTKSNLIAAKMLIKKIDKEDLDVMMEGFKKPALNIRRVRKRKKQAPKPGQMFTFITGPLGWIRSFFSKLSGYFGSGMSTTTRSVSKIKKSHYLKPILKWAGIVLSLALLIVFVSSTARHLFQKQTPEKTESTILKIATTDPFTIQVAAYRQEINAKKYIGQLKENGLDAYYVVVHTSSSKWYQVRISHFRTKDEARTYGLSLKKKGKIKDFYVANYKNPEQND